MTLFQSASISFAAIAPEPAEVKLSVIAEEKSDPPPPPPTEPGESIKPAVPPTAAAANLVENSKEGSGLETATNAPTLSADGGQVETAPSLDEPSHEPPAISPLHEAIKATVSSMPAQPEAKGQMSPEDMEYERIKTTYAVPLATQTTPPPPAEDYFEMIDGTKVYMDAPNTIMAPSPGLRCGFTVALGHGRYDHLFQYILLTSVIRTN